MVMNVDYYNKQQRAKGGPGMTVKHGPTRNCSKTFHVYSMTKKIEEKNKSLLCSPLPPFVKRKSIKAGILHKKIKGSSHKCVVQFLPLVCIF